MDFLFLKEKKNPSKPKFWAYSPVLIGSSPQLSFATIKNPPLDFRTDALYIKVKTTKL